MARPFAMFVAGLSPSHQARHVDHARGKAPFVVIPAKQPQLVVSDAAALWPCQDQRFRARAQIRGHQRVIRPSQNGRDINSRAQGRIGEIFCKRGFGPNDQIDGRNAGGGHARQRR